MMKSVAPVWDDNETWLVMKTEGDLKERSRAQAFPVVGMLAILPIFFMYAGWSYGVFRDKVRAELGYDRALASPTAAGVCETAMARAWNHFEASNPPAAIECFRVQRCISQSARPVNRLL